MTIAENLSQLRNERGLSQTALAKLAGVSQQLISQIENGANLTTKHLVALAKALDVKLDAIDPNYAGALEIDGFDELRSMYQKLDEEGRAALLTVGRAMQSKAAKRS